MAFVGYKNNKSGAGGRGNGRPRGEAAQVRVTARATSQPTMRTRPVSRSIQGWVGERLATLRFVHIGGTSLSLEVDHSIRTNHEQEVFLRALRRLEQHRTGSDYDVV